MNPTLTAKDAAAISKVTVHTIHGWIRGGKIIANKIGAAYFIDRESLDRHLANRSVPKAASDISAHVTAAATLPEGPVAAPVAPVDPIGETQRPDFRGLAALPANDPRPPDSKTSEPAKRLAVPTSPAIPNPNVATSGSKKAAKGHWHEAGKAFKNSRVRYAKDAMRKFNLEQLRDIRTWILHRMDLKTKSA